MDDDIEDDDNWQAETDKDNSIIGNDEDAGNIDDVDDEDDDDEKDDDEDRKLDLESMKATTMRGTLEYRE